MRHRHRYNAPQFDLPGMEQAFNLAGQTTTDGDRAAAERERAEREHAEAKAKETKEQLTMNDNTPKQYRIKEVKLLRLREVQVNNPHLTTPEEVFNFWQENIPNAVWFDPDKETLVCLMVNTRKRIIGFTMVSIGSMDTLLVHPREVFKTALVQGAAAIILAHNHPSGEPTPSDADIKVTRDLIRAGQLLKIDVLDHVIIGEKGQQSPAFVSLRECGYFNL